MFSSCFPGARLDLSDEDNVIALALTECSARPYAELIKSNIPSSSSLMSARFSTSRPPPPFALGVSSFGPTAATPTRREILVHLGATSRKPRSAKRKKPSSSEKDRPVQKFGVSPPSPVREPERASPPLVEVRNSGVSSFSCPRAGAGVVTLGCGSEIGGVSSFPCPRARAGVAAPGRGSEFGRVSSFSCPRAGAGVVTPGFDLTASL